MKEYLETTAIYSPYSMYRYVLKRTWPVGNDKLVTFVLLNPSTATEHQDDPTIRRCVRFAIQWGYSGLYILNLFGYRATLPSDMRKAYDPVGPENLKYIKETQTELVVVGWGNHGTYKGQDKIVLNELNNPHSLGINKNGTPKHPLYVPYSSKLELYTI